MKTGHEKGHMAKVSIVLIILLALLMSTISVYALTANIGNARMVLRANVGDTIEKTILVKNINNESIELSVYPSGELGSDITVKDTNFTLAPGEEKNARFTIKVTKEGTTESKINVKFYSPSEKKGVGLSSTVILIVNSSETTESTDNNDTTGNTDTTDSNGTSIENKVNVTNIINMGPLMISFAVTGVILLVFLVLLIVYYVKSKKKDSEKNGEVVVKETKPKKKVSEK